MKKICLLYSMIAMSLYACSKKQQGTDTFHRLSSEQLAFINTAKTGDTCIWESSLGYRDTGIVQPVVTEKYLIRSPSFDGNVYGEKAYYTYSFVGKKKTMIGYGIYVIATDSPKYTSNGLLLKAPNGVLGEIDYQGVLNPKKIGLTVYNNVYWQAYPLDSIFWNINGVLGYYKSEEIVVKIK